MSNSSLNSETYSSAENLFSENTEDLLGTALLVHVITELKRC